MKILPNYLVVAQYLTPSQLPPLASSSGLLSLKMRVWFYLYKVFVWCYPIPLKEELTKQSYEEKVHVMNVCINFCIHHINTSTLGARFTSSVSDLKRHFLIHTGERHLVCAHEGCGKIFSIRPLCPSDLHQLRNRLHNGRKNI
ncbi:zinc finger protein [Striga asiatica]|uniref:Zinc finger protein n=1 Tax=Striga asiatica TaxID=4170 RepID=A0A5A7QG87_STRAF|nr:zinc finger protein [Striga asiatica]